MSVDQLPPGKAPAAKRDTQFVRYDEYIDKQIQTTRRMVKTVDVMTALLVMATGALGFLLVAAIVEHWLVPGGFNLGIRLLLFFALCGSLLFYTTRRLWPLISGSINPAYAAHAIEQDNPSLKNSLLNLLLFREHRDDVTDAVYETLEEQAARRLTRVPVDSAVDRTQLLRLGYVLVAVVAAVALYKILSPKDPFVSAERVLMPWARIVPASRVSIENVEPGAVKLARGEVLTVSADVRGISDDDPVVIRYTTADGQAVDRPAPMTPSSVGLRFTGHIPPAGDGAKGGVAQNLRYRIEAGDARSLEYAVTVVAAPTITIERIDYDYPDYTGYTDRSVERLGDIRAIEGTRVTIHARANQPIEDAAVDFEADGRRDVKLTATGNEAQASFSLELRDDRKTPKYTSYVLRFTGSDGRPNRDPVKFPIDVTPDYAPEVSITAPAEKVRDVRLDETVAIEVDSHDPDFALADVRLHGEAAGRPVLDEKMLAQPNVHFSGRLLFTPNEHDLKPGDVVRYWVVARDNRTTQSNESVSDSQSLRIVGADPGKPGKQPRDRNSQQEKREPQDPNQSQEGQQQDGEGGESGGQGSDSSAGNQQGESATGESASADGQSGQQSEQDSADQTGENNSGENNSGENNAGKNNSGEQSNQQSGESNSQSQSSGEGESQSKQQGESGDTQQESGGNNSNGEQNSANPSAGKPDSNNNQSGEKNDGTSNGNAAQNARRQPGAGGKPQPGSESSPVSPEGDNDGEAFERIQDFLNREGQLPQESKEPSGESKSQQGESATGESASADGKNANQSENAQPNQSSETKPGDESESPTGSADASNPASDPNRDPGTGTRPSNAQEKSGDPSEQGNPNDGQDSKSPDGQHTSSDGESGAGKQPDESQGSPEAQPNNEPGDKWQQKPSGDQQDDQQGEHQEAPSGGKGNRKNDSQGDQGGDRGGGEEGAGQKSEREGTGSAGQNQSADEGAGESSEQGTGSNSPDAGQDAKSNDRTGQSGSEEQGAGSTQRDGEGDKPGGSQKQNDGAESGSGDNEPQAKPGAEPASSGSESSENPTGSEGTANEQQQNPGSQSSGSNTADGAGRVPEGIMQPSKSEGNAPEADAANLEYARKQTDLVLETLAEQMKRQKVDKRLLDELGWSEAELKRFLQRWQQLKAAAQDNTPAGDEAQRELDDALRSLGLRRGQLQQAKVSDDNNRNLRQGYHGAIPLEYQERLRAYNQGVSRARQEEE